MSQSRTSSDVTLDTLLPFSHVLTLKLQTLTNERAHNIKRE
jgi:hypothetical protein